MRGSYLAARGTAIMTEIRDPMLGENGSIDGKVINNRKGMYVNNAGQSFSTNTKSSLVEIIVSS